MTASETSFRNWFIRKNRDKVFFIQKVPDFKMAGHIVGVAGLPDYFTVVDGFVVWYEVKSISGYSINLHHFTDAQLRVFPKLVAAGSKVLVWVKYKKSLSCAIIPFEEIFVNKSVKVDAWAE